MKVYGIKNCDTVKKALKWLESRGINYEFHDFKKLGVNEEKLKAWSDRVGWENLLNKRGTTWKKLDPAEQQSITSEEAAFKLMKEKTSVIRRPVIEGNEAFIQGFDEQVYEKQLK